MAGKKHSPSNFEELYRVSLANHLKVINETLPVNGNVGYRSPEGFHRHECWSCNEIWEHNDTCIGDSKSHTCKNCGVEIWRRYTGFKKPNKYEEKSLQ